MIKVLFICHGNICRSTMAESVFTHLVRQRGLSDQFKIYSAGVSREEIGAGVHRGTRQVLKEKGIPVVEHFADQVTWQDYHHYDYLICMDRSNIELLKTIILNDDQNKVHLLLSFLHLKCRKDQSSKCLAQKTSIEIGFVENPSGGLHDSLTCNSSTCNNSSTPDVPTPDDLREDRIPDIADPWYTGDYEATYRDVLAGCEAFLDYIMEKEHLKNGRIEER